MAYNDQLVDRIRDILSLKNVDFYDKKMFGGICFMVDDKMCCGTHIDKKTNEDLLLCRVGEDVYAASLEKEGCIPMEFTGKPMKGYVYVRGEVLDSQKTLAYWIQLCLDFNHLAKKSKK